MNKKTIISQILEVTPVIQGEGQSVGFPMILIRLGGCNLNCMFSESICDSEESSWDFKTKSVNEYCWADVEKIIEDNPQIHYAMITGGQPTMNKKLFKELVNLLLQHNMKVEIEDNGTTFINDLNPKLLNLVTLSPKLSNSIPKVGVYIDKLKRVTTQKDVDRHASRYRNIPSMKKWVENFNYQLKFVISNKDQIKEALSLVKDIGADLNKVYFMPEGSTRKQLASRRQWLYETCLSLGIKYTDRLSVLVYDELKGV